MSSISEWSQDLELWKGHLKEVEGKTKCSSVGLYTTSNGTNGIYITWSALPLLIHRFHYRLVSRQIDWL